MQDARHRLCARTPVDVHAACRNACLRMSSTAATSTPPDAAAAPFPPADPPLFFFLFQWSETAAPRPVEKVRLRLKGPSLRFCARLSELSWSQRTAKNRKARGSSCVGAQNKAHLTRRADSEGANDDQTASADKITIVCMIHPLQQRPFHSSAPHLSPLPGKLEFPTLRLTASRSSQLSYGSHAGCQASLMRTNTSRCARDM